MIMKSENNDAIAVYCSCGCCDGVIFRAEYVEDVGYELTLVSDLFNSSECSLLERFKKKWKRILKILKNKEHSYFCVYIKKEELEEFKQFISTVQNTSNESISDEQHTD